MAYITAKIPMINKAAILKALLVSNKLLSILIAFLSSFLFSKSEMIMITTESKIKAIPIRSINGMLAAKYFKAADRGMENITTQKAEFADVRFQKIPKIKTTTIPGLIKPVYS